MGVARHGAAERAPCRAAQGGAALRACAHGRALGARRIRLSARRGAAPGLLMRGLRGIGALLAILVIAGIGLLQRDSREPLPAPEPAPTAQPPAPVATTVGFRSSARLNEHYEKHGHEFGDISKAEYLEQAQALRDGPAGGDILEIRRPDG